MQNTTKNYKLEINKPSREFECKITIGDNIYTNEDLVNLTLEYTQPQEGFSIGNTISQSLDLTLLNRSDIIYSTSQIKVEIGLKVGSKFEYILMGIFNIDDIEKTDYTTKFTAYDNMIKFESVYFSKLGNTPTLQQVINELENKTGVKFIGTLPTYTVTKLEGFSCREVLSYVASICGGNAFITREGKFTIKGLCEVEKTIDGNNYFEYKKEEIKYKIGKISCQVDENNILSKGSISTDSMELEFENPWITENILNDIYTKLKSIEYLGYSIKWQGDISLDPYDIITITDVKNITRRVPIFSQKFSYTGGLTSEIGAKGESKNKNSFSSSGSTSNKVNRVVMEQAVIKEALINKANIRDLEASNAKIENLQVKAASIESAIIGVAYISDLTAINANIQNLIAADAKINTALINKADITELNAVQGNITSLNSQIANIQTLVNGNLSSENIQAGGITSDKLTIANGFITNAMIANLDVSKINAGDISTNKFRIVSDNGGIEIVGATQQFKDKNNKVRIQMGQDTKGNFNFILRGEDGDTTLIDHTGIKERAIADDLIKENMVATDAIGEKQINYSSLITGLNKDTNTQLIKASKVAIDLAGQTLDLAFNSLKNQADNNKNIIENHSTNISAMQGQISTAINNTQIVKDGKTILLKDDYNRTISKVDSINSTIGTHTTKINELTGNIISVDTKVNSVQRDLEGTKSTVSSHTNLIDGLNSKLSTQGSSIEQLKNQITLKVNSTELNAAINKKANSTDVYTKTEVYTKAQTDSAIKVAKDEINLGVKNTYETKSNVESKISNAVNNVQVGGRNYIRQGRGDKKGGFFKNFKKVENGYGEHTLTSQKTYSYVDITNGFILGCRDYEDGRKVTISYDFMYTAWNFPAGTDRREFWMGQRYTKSSSTSSTGEWRAVTQHNLPVIGENGCELNKWIHIEKTMTIPAQAHSSIGTASSIQFYNSNANVSASITFRIKNVKIEYGTKATDWTPAPEDIDTIIDSKANSVDVYKKTETYSKAQTDSAIKVAKDSIELGVKNTYETKTNVESKITTAVNNMQVGGRNLLKDTSKELKSVTFGGWDYYFPNNITSWEKNKTLTGNIYLKPTEQDASCMLHVRYKDSSYKQYRGNIISAGKEGYSTVTITVPNSDDISHIQFSIRHSSSSTPKDVVYYKEAKVEKGNKATDFTPAPEDVDLAIDKKANVVDVYKKSETYTKAQTDSAIKVAKDSINLSVSGTYETKTNVETKINTAKSNAINSAKSYTDGQITTVNKTITNKVAEIKATTDSISQKVSTTESKITTINNNISGLTNRVSTAESKLTSTSLTTTISSAISGGTSSISTTQFVMDKNGFTIKNGALTIKNKAGTTVLNSDTDGNLLLTGTVKSQSGERYVSLDSGGITFNDAHKNEQMLRVAMAYFPSNRDINGVTFAMPKYSDFIRFSHINKTNLTSGWSSTDTHYNFFDLWSAEQTIGSTKYYKGINTFAHLYIRNNVTLDGGVFNFKHSNGNTPSKIFGSTTNHLCLIGDSGVTLGIYNGTDSKTAMQIKEVTGNLYGTEIELFTDIKGNGRNIYNVNINKSLVSRISKKCSETTYIEGQYNQLRINFTDIKIVNGKAYINIPKIYLGLYDGYIISSIVKKDFGQVWIESEEERRFILVADRDMKVNVEVILKLCD